MREKTDGRKTKIRGKYMGREMIEKERERKRERKIERWRGLGVSSI